MNDVARDERGLWLPGRSANPGGRPSRDNPVKIAARKHGTAAIDTLFELMQDKKQPGAVRVSAARELLDRAYGRPEQAVSVDVELARKKISELTLDEVRELKAKIALTTIEAVAVEVVEAEAVEVVAEDVGGGGAGEPGET
jgi:hypothetical protein